MIAFKDILESGASVNAPIFFSINNNLVPVVDYIATSPSDIKFFTDQDLINDVVDLKELISYIDLEGMQNVMLPGKEFKLATGKIVIK